MGNIYRLVELNAGHRWPQQDYPIQATTWPSGGLAIQNGKGNRKIALVSYTIVKHASKNGKIHTIAVGNTKSNWAGYGLDILE